MFIKITQIKLNIHSFLFVIKQFSRCNGLYVYKYRPATENITLVPQDRFHMDLGSASRSLGVCATSLKRVCRRHGISKCVHHGYSIQCVVLQCKIMLPAVARDIIALVQLASAIELSTLQIDDW